MKIKVAELEGGRLNYWVAKADGKEACIRPWYENAKSCVVIEANPRREYIYSPSSGWSQGGPIIEREHIMLEPGGPGDSWVGHIWLSEAVQWLCIEGPTPLIAAMRCFVASKFGEEVEE